MIPSAEDQAILEEAYKRDPKPDKAARQELVKKVALGEKEVQVGHLRSDMTTPTWSVLTRTV